MMGTWADELTNSEPRPEHETFYLLVALKLGDPNTRSWIMDNAKEFYAMWKNYSGSDDEGPEVLIQYLLWYERDQPEH